MRNGTGLLSSTALSISLILKGTPTIDACDFDTLNENLSSNNPLLHETEADITAPSDLSTIEGEKQAFCKLNGLLLLSDDVRIVGRLFIGSTLKDKVAEVDEFQADRTSA